MTMSEYVWKYMKSESNEIFLNIYEHFWLLMNIYEYSRLLVNIYIYVKTLEYIYM